MEKIAKLFGALVTASVVACSTLPTSGPTNSQVADQAKEGQARFDLIEMDDHVTAVLSAQPAESLHAKFEQYGKPPPPKIGVGDTISVSIWQTSAAGLIGEAPGAIGTGTGTGVATGGTGAVGGNTPTVALPEQVVAPDGSISVPYAGRVAVADRTPLQVQQTIEHLLTDRAIEPQVIVSIIKSASNTVTVSGEFLGGARVPLSVRGDRLLDVIAAAGGSKAPLYETFVRLSRNGVTLTIPMDRLTSDPEENIYAWPDDVITLTHVPQTFSVFGATLNNSQLPFGADHINLAQAIAKAGGLQDTRADPAGVFLFRFEPQPVVTALGAVAIPTAPGGASPVIYHLNLQNIGGYFLAGRFPVRNDDIIYVANASSNDVQKFFTLVATLTGPIIGGVVVTRGSGH